MSRAEWILGILLAILLLLIMVMGLFFWLQPDVEFAGAVTPPPGAQVIDDLAVAVAPTQSAPGRTAVLAYAAALERARSWQEDAQIVQARTTWPQGAERELFVSGASNWDFSFYSAAAGAVMSVTVVDDAVNVSSPRVVDRPVDAAPISAWRLDSDEVMLRFLLEAGDDAMQRQPITLTTMSLTFSNDEPRAEWLVTMFIPATGETVARRYDADSGALIEEMPTATPMP